MQILIWSSNIVIRTSTIAITHTIAILSIIVLLSSICIGFSLKPYAPAPAYVTLAASQITAINHQSITERHKNVVSAEFSN